MKDYVIKCGQLIDGTGSPAITDARILVKGERIARVEPGPGSDLDAFSEVIDASGKTVMPGLIDSHKHLFNNGGPTVGIGLTPAQIFRNMKTSLWGGVTSCLDLGSPNTIKTHLKLTSKKPRVYYAITILTCPGGYPSEYMPKLHYKMGAAKEVGTDKEIKTTVRKLAEKGVSVIKTVTVTRTLDGGNLVGWTDHQLRTLCDEAHGWGLKVCSHITYVQDYAQAIRCGVDSVHHAAFDDIMKEEDLDAMVEKGMVFVPTLSLFDLFVAGFSEKWHERPDFDPPVNNPVKKAIKEFTEEWEKTPDDKAVDGTFIKIPKGEFAQAAQNQVRSLAKYVEKGGIVAMGTDSSLGFSFHSTPVRELELLHQCGMSPLEVIKASTLTSASVFDKEKEIGSIEPGKLADILIVDGDPLSDINTVGNTDTVILGGRVMVDGKK